MDQMTIYVEQGGSVFFSVNHVFVPELVVERACVCLRIDATHMVFLGMTRF